MKGTAPEPDNSMHFTASKPMQSRNSKIEEKVLSFLLMVWKKDNIFCNVLLLHEYVRSV